MFFYIFFNDIYFSFLLGSISLTLKVLYYIDEVVEQETPKDKKDDGLYRQAKQFVVLLSSKNEQEIMMIVATKT